MESYIHLYKTNDKFTEAYNGPDYKEPWLSLTEENMKVNYNKPKLTAITFNSITWVTDVASTGGTATKNNCSFEVYAKYDNGISVDISSDATVTGELVVAETTATTRQSVGTLTLTAKYKGVTCTGSVVAYQEAVNPSMSPLTFKISSPGTINWTASNSSVTKTIEYNLNNGDKWVSITSNTGSSAPTINVVEGDKIQFRGNNTAYCGDNPELYSTFGGSTAGFEIEGNIMSLINPKDFSTLTTLGSNFTFASLFERCTGLTSAENLILPATTLAMGCYTMMFAGCTSLTTAPALPAMTLAIGCYDNMFNGCTSLITAPELPATTLADYCYNSMFRGCTSLTTAPALPAMTLANSCYNGMFDGCTSLTTVPSDYLPATTLAEGCYHGMFGGCTGLTIAPELPVTSLVKECYRGMFAGCSSLKTAPELPATTLADYCYSNMFYKCASLTVAPQLPVTTLAEGCYECMFQNCSSLTTAPALPATTLAPNCYGHMFQNCASLTTAPELPATSLVEECYAHMFDYCEKLNYIKCLATDISATRCTSYWVPNVASTGTFVKAAGMTGWSTGYSGIPGGWTVQDAS